MKTILKNCLPSYHHQALGLKPLQTNGPQRSPARGTLPRSREPYLGGVEGRDDPHAVRVVVVLNREVGGSDDARGAPKVGITHAGCREKVKV